MKRHCVALLVHPYKNRLIPREELRESLDGCLRELVAIAEDHRGVRFNLVVPGYILELADGIVLNGIRELRKRGALEWLATGYTEPFVSMSPAWLSRQNVESGIDTYAELLGTKPEGYVPPFANWEPSFIEVLRDLGLTYGVLSEGVFAADYRHRLGFWTAEHAGASIGLFPVHAFHHSNAPASLREWLRHAFGADTEGRTPNTLAGIQYMVPLDAPHTEASLGWLRGAAEALEEMSLEFQSVLFGEYFSDNQPLGLQYVPPSLVFDREREERIHSFGNWLFTHDQVGMIHRKMTEVCGAVASRKDTRTRDRLVRQLFFVQDINRFLPGPASGFPHLSDRLWSYRRLVEIEGVLSEEVHLKGGQIRIADYLRNGSKSIVMSNKGLTVGIDHRKGGAVFELDFRERALNLLAGYNHHPHVVPGIVVPGESRMAFVDHFLPPDVRRAESVGGASTQLGDFLGGRFEYKIKKTKTGVKAVLTRQGALLQGGRNCPLNMEKVFALEGDGSGLSFVYQLSNGSLTPYSFTFATEMTFSLLGAAGGEAQVELGDSEAHTLGREPLWREGIKQLVLTDRRAGVKVQLGLQKEINVWCFPVGDGVGEDTPYQGTTMVISVPVELAGNSAWTLMGKLSCRKLRRKEEARDAV